MLNVYYNPNSPLQSFAVGKLAEALRKSGETPMLRNSLDAPRSASSPAVVVSLAQDGIVRPRGALEAEGFSVQREGAVLHVVGQDERGAMYGALEVVDRLDMGARLGSIGETVQNPFISMRGIRYCVPWSVYDNGEAFAENWETSWDLDHWKSYFDFLAEHRHNCVTLWSRHPFHFMFRLEKYPRTTNLSDEELKRNIAFFRELFRYAKDRGVDTYIITWNVDVVPCVVEGLGLPPELADYNSTHHLRQSSALLKDYFKECVRTLLQTYPDLTGLGTAGAEEMVGTNEEREQWLTDTYMAGVKESGRIVPFIHRTQHQTGRPIKELWVDKYPGQTYISWKYSVAHMYAHPKPVFEEKLGVWKGIDMDEVKVTYTVRNDDFFTLRWGDPDWVREYLLNMKVDKPYVHGFYWGASGYMWGDDFQHRDDERVRDRYPSFHTNGPDRRRRNVAKQAGHKTWKYDFEKHVYEFALLGRLAYNPDLPADLWKAKVFGRYDRELQDELFEAFKSASKVIPAVNTYYWKDNHFEWYPEGCLSRFGFKTVKDFVENSPQPGSGALKTTEYVAGALAGQRPGGRPPEEFVQTLRASSEATLRRVTAIRARVGPENLVGELKCILYDLEAWGHLGAYYADKIAAAVELAFFQQTGDEGRRSLAVALLERGLRSWEQLALVGARHYLPYFHAATKHVFSWGLLLEEVEQDVQIARSFARE